MKDEEIELVINQLYDKIDGYEISSIARKKLLISDRALTYGEVSPSTFGKILAQVNPQSGEIFYDLGSGTGKAVFLAHFYYDFSKSIGIELLEDLYLSANSILNKYNQDIRPKLNQFKPKQIISFINGDIFKKDFSDADVVFFHSTCFNDEIIAKLEDKLSMLKKGVRIITVTKSLHLPIFRLLKSEMYDMGWGKATVNFYIK